MVSNANAPFAPFDFKTTTPATPSPAHQDASPPPPPKKDWVDKCNAISNCITSLDKLAWTIIAIIAIIGGGGIAAGITAASRGGGGGDTAIGSAPTPSATPASHPSAPTLFGPAPTPAKSGCIRLVQAEDDACHLDVQVWLGNKHIVPNPLPREACNVPTGRQSYTIVGSPKGCSSSLSFPHGFPCVWYLDGAVDVTIGRTYTFVWDASSCDIRLA